MSKEGKIYYPWQETYPRELGLAQSRGLRELPDCAWAFPETDNVLNKWKYQQKQITVNTVVVSPNEGELPMRAMSYLIGAAQLADNLKKGGWHIAMTRIINPCYLNVYCDEGNLRYQLAYGQNLLENMRTWIEHNIPDIADIPLVIDQGSPITDSIQSNADVYAANIHDKTYSVLTERITNHSGFNDRAAVYLMAHPFAWQYAQTTEPLFFQKAEGDAVINYMPQSEMLFLTTMKQAEIEIQPERSNVVTLISRRLINAPYYFLKEDEPPTSWLVQATDIQNYMTDLRPRAGHMHYAEILANLGYIRTIMQNNGRR